MSDESKTTTTDSSGGCCGCLGGGLTIPGVIAFALSWGTFHSFWWALLAAVFGWGYVVYWLVYYWR